MEGGGGDGGRRRMEGGEGWREAMDGGRRGMEAGEGWRQGRDGERGGMEREGVRREEGARCRSSWWALSSSFSNIVRSRHSLLGVGGICRLRAVVAVFD